MALVTPIEAARDQDGAAWGIPGVIARIDEALEEAIVAMAALQRAKRELLRLEAALAPALPFPALLRQHRDRRHWSQERLAEAAELDHSLVSRMEVGTRPPTRRSLRKLADGLGLDPDERDRLYTTAGFLPPSCAAYFDD